MDKKIAILSADKVKLFKPHSAVYELIPKHFTIERHEIAFVSCNPWDAKGAANYGFKVFWCNRSENPCDNLPGTFQVEMKNLGILPEIIGNA